MPPVSRIIPLIVCEDIQATHDFLVSAFGFEAGGVQLDATVARSTVRSAAVTR